LYASKIPQCVRDIYDKFPATDEGPGGHILTGPVAIAEAQPGDVLRNHSIPSNRTLRNTAVYRVIASEWPTVRTHLHWPLTHLR
jgi:acetamidase/formamidase